MNVWTCIAHPRHLTWWRRCYMQGSLVQSILWGTWPQHGQCRCHQSSTCSGRSLQPSRHDSPRPGSSLLQGPWERDSEARRSERNKEEESRWEKEREKSDYWTNMQGMHINTYTDPNYQLTCVWSSSSPGIPWQRRSVWPCRAAPQRSPPPFHNLSSSPVGCHVACTLSRCRTEAPGYTHLWEAAVRIQMPTTTK